MKAWLTLLLLAGAFVMVLITLLEMEIVQLPDNLVDADVIAPHDNVIPPAVNTLREGTPIPMVTMVHKVLTPTAPPTPASHKPTTDVNFYSQAQITTIFANTSFRPTTDELDSLATSKPPTTVQNLTQTVSAVSTEQNGRITTEQNGRIATEELTGKPPEEKTKSSKSLEDEENIPIDDEDGSFVLDSLYDKKEISDIERAKNERSPMWQDRMKAMFWNWYESHVNSKSKKKYCMRWTTKKCCEVARLKNFEILHDTLPPPSATDVTLVTFGTFNRIKAFQRTCAAWSGPKVIVLYFVDYNDGDTETIAQQLDETRRFFRFDTTCTKVLVRAYIAKGPDKDTSDVNTVPGPPMHPLIPINALRNVAMDSARTRFIFPTDIDFYPSFTLYNTLLKMEPLLSQMNRAAIVIPQFAAFDCDFGKKVNESLFHFKDQAIATKFDELYNLLRLGRVKTFHGDNGQMKLSKSMDPHCDISQNDETPLFQTNYTRWLQESVAGHDGAYRIRAWMAQTKTVKVKHVLYEPYVVVSRVDAEGNGVPRYNELFVGYYKNKISWLTSLRIYRYRFYVLRREFLMHAPHKKSKRKQETSGHYQLMWAVYQYHIAEGFQKRPSLDSTIPCYYCNGFDETDLYLAHE